MSISAREGASLEKLQSITHTTLRLWPNCLKSDTPASLAALSSPFLFPAALTLLFDGLIMRFFIGSIRICIFYICYTMQNCGVDLPIKKSDRSTRNDDEEKPLGAKSCIAGHRDAALRRTNQ
jgi:hypothetical protein